MSTQELAAEARERAGKGAARALRREDKVPAVIYGDKKPPVSIAVSKRELNRLIHAPGFFTHTYDVKVGKDSHHVIARDLHMDPVSDQPLHVDFLRVSDRTVVTVDVPVRFLNEEESPGLTAGGVLNVVRYTIEVNSRAGSIPEHIEIDLAGTELGDSIHISQITLPDGVKPTITDRDFTVATIAAPSAVKAEAAEEAEAEEAEEEEAEEGEEEEGESEESED